MEKCSVCGRETFLYSDGKPICVECDDARDKHASLQKRLATERQKLTQPESKEPK